MRNNIVQERTDKQLKQMCLLERFDIRDPDLTVRDLIRLCSAQLSENIQVRRFVRFTVNETQSPPLPDTDSGIPIKPLPNPPDSLSSEAEFE